MVKGQLVAVTGAIQVRSYDGKDGQKKWATDVIADDVRFLEWKKREPSEDTGEIDIPFDNEDRDDIPF